MSDRRTYVIKAKCRNCGLHFAAYSWSEDWLPSYCPECGAGGMFMVWKEESDDFIFQHIPGDSPLVFAGVR
jgi:predicted Zn-ribbon and HTH transcriptional regulator